MKKLLLFILVAASFTGVSVTASYAQNANNNATSDPGCSPQMMTILTNQANAVRARDRAYEMEIISREPSTLYLTCFDQALALSARLGYIFSDNITPNPPPPNTLAFKDTLLYPDWGAQHSLAVDLNNVITPLLDAWLGGAVSAPAVYNFYPQWQKKSNALSILVTQIQKVISNIQSDQTNLQGQVSSYNNQVQKIDQLVNSFPTIAWNDLPGKLTDYNNLITQLTSTMNSIQNQEQSDIKPLLDEIKNDVFNAHITCTNIDDMWDGNGAFNNPSNTETSFYSPEGPYNVLTPFYSMEDLLNYGETGAMNGSLKVPSNNPGVATFYFNTELTRSTDKTLLQKALSDLVGPLQQPAGGSTLWPAPPQFPSYFQTQDIIQQM